MIVHVVGARPQFVKLKAVYDAIAKFATLRQRVIHTGQHYDYEMSRVFFEELDIPEPVKNLAVGSADHPTQISLMLQGVAALIRSYHPDWIVAYGDTNSTLAAALAANMCSVRLAHVEAGMRSFRLGMAEERNRIVTDHLSDTLFAASKTAMANLSREGLAGRAVLCGDVMLDVLRRLHRKGCLQEQGILGRQGVEGMAFVVSTIHRAENVDERKRLEEIILGLAALELPVIFPMHPRTRRALRTFGLEEALCRGDIRVVDPLGYLDMLRLVRAARVVVTDSGGLQKEAYYLRVPCVTVREETEWPETVDVGANRLVPASSSAIVKAVRCAMEQRVTAWPDIYGNGTAAKCIAHFLVTHS